MPWEKQFDPDDALDKAMNAFWAHGYEATSVQDLTECMGINRGSLYATFGDKRRLFIQVLRRYDTLHRDAWAEKLRLRAGSPRKAITMTFDDAVDRLVETGAGDGCLLVNTALELSAHDDEIAEIVRHGLAEMEAFFRNMIEEGQKSGEIAANVSPVETGRSLLSLLLGLRVLSRSRPERAFFRSVANQAEALLN